MSRDLNEGGIENIGVRFWAKRKRSQCQVTEEALDWAYSRKIKEDPVAGADGAEANDQ